MDVGERLETAVRQAPAPPQGDAEAIYVRGRRRARRRKTLIGAAGAAALMGVVTFGVQTVDWLRPGEVEIAEQPDASLTGDETDRHEPELRDLDSERALQEWHGATGKPIVVPTRLPDGYHMVIANHYAPTSPESSLPPVAACIVPAGTTDESACAPTDDPSPRTSIDVDGHTVVLEVMDGSRDQTILDTFKQLDWTTEWRQVDWIDTAFEQSSAPQEEHAPRSSQRPATFPESRHL